MWDIRYRPLCFSDVLGQESTIKILKSRLQNGTALDTSYIFAGGFGQGKTTLGRILARALICLQRREDGEPCNECPNCKAILDDASDAFVEIDAASKGTIENVRAIVDDLPYAVVGSPKRIYIVDECHRMSRDAQDVLLKPLEEKRFVGIFCTTEADKIRGPIRSRCEEYHIRKVTRVDIAKRMAWILGQEGVTFEEDALLTIIDYSGGHIRDILNRLEMVAQMGPVTLSTVREYLSLSVVTTYYEILLALGSPSLSVPLVEQACDRVGPEDVASGLAEAAMNSFRLAHRMFADFSHVDRELAQKVYALYGENVVRLAEYFLRTYRPSRIGLVCDVIRCAGGVPESVTGASPPPIVIATPASASPKTTDTETVQVSIEPAQQSVPESAVTEQSEIRTNSVDPAAFALTKLDHMVIPQKMPRGHDRRKDKPTPLLSAGVDDPEGDVISTARWRREFLLATGRLKT